jgi:pilus assembly protein Flp/PilA
MTLLASLLRDESAATMVEYGIMVALVAAVCIILVLTLGKNVSNSFESVNSSL